MNFTNLLKTASLPAALLIALLVQPVAFGGTVVADKDFNGDTSGMSGGNGMNMNTNGPPSGGAGVGTWVANGYTPGAGDDTNPNMATASLWVVNQPRVPSALGHAVETDNGGDFVGYIRSDAPKEDLDGILQFSEAANAGDTVKGEFQVYYDKGVMSWGLVSSVADLKASQAARVWDGTGYRPGLVAHHNGGAYTNGLATQIAMRPQSNNNWAAIVDNGAGTAAWTHLRNGNGDFLKSYGAAPNLPNNWLQFEFEYTVGNSSFDKLQANYTTDGTDKVVYDVLTSGGDSVIPVTGGNTIEGIVFSGGEGQRTGYWIDEIYIEVTAAIPEPCSVLLVLMGSCGLGFYRRR
ncbi:MAG: hypothetical protein MK161_09400 [Pirellulales bacterium]|nr:hypothetical protein [Pirellulales bacterium]